MMSKTHCKRGHVLDSENLYVSPKGHRVCRVCKSMNKRSRATGRRAIQYAVKTGHPSHEMLADADRRANAPRDLTAMIFGDPPRGHSALDRREGVC